MELWWVYLSPTFGCFASCLTISFVAFAVRAPTGISTVGVICFALPLFSSLLYCSCCCLISCRELRIVLVLASFNWVFGSPLRTLDLCTSGFAVQQVSVLLVHYVVVFPDGSCLALSLSRHLLGVFRWSDSCFATGVFTSFVQDCLPSFVEQLNG